MLNEVAYATKKQRYYRKRWQIMNISDEIAKKQFIQREYGLAHPTYDRELDFYRLVCSGDVKTLTGMLLAGEEDDVTLKSRGILSEDKVRNRRYHEIVLVAMISRFCIEEGMEEMESYNLSDFYINRLDKAQTQQQITDVHNQVLMDYAKRMRHVKNKEVMSLHCVRTMDYVYDHLHEKIEISEIAEYVGVERSYLSRLFRKEVGQTLSDYVMDKKLQAAKNMLLCSDFSCMEISQYLAFASNSYFTKCFREKFGSTPGAYRKENYRKHWKKSWR